MTELNTIINFLIHSRQSDFEPVLPVKLSNLSKQQNNETRHQNFNAAFLILLAGENHPEYSAARKLLEKAIDSPDWKNLSGFYRQSVQLITEELKQVFQQDSRLKEKFQKAAGMLSEHPADNKIIAEILWSVFFPEGTGIRWHENERVTELRKKRTVTVTRLNPNPIQDPARQILFTSNVLLTTPLPGSDLSGFDPEFKSQLTKTLEEPQLYWYDHPIPIGIENDSNEILYGLKNLNHAVEVENKRQNGETTKVNCVLSISVTHKRLQTLGKKYLRQLFSASTPLRWLNVFAFTEEDAKELIEKVLRPVVDRCLPDDDSAALHYVFGVDGRYGRHYSFLKAIAALWQVLIEPQIKATFKIDLDQVFPQKELIEQTGASAFEHFRTPLWGAEGLDAEGHPIELGMIAGALVNQKDIHKGIFTPDVTFPETGLKPDEYIFFSRLPQALSTAAEMMTRYRNGTVPDGRKTCLQRIHVTGGTNGILIESLRRRQPFTPGFIARAEDQAYILSTLGRSTRLGYVHASGLIMRHDKEGFAQEAIVAAKAGKQIGDYLRILIFSAYADVLPPGREKIKNITDPFTGCFVSQIPVTVTLLRFAFRVAALFNENHTEEAVEFMRIGIPQLRETFDFIQARSGALRREYERERQGWRLFYNCLDKLEQAVQANENWALKLQKSAQKIVSGCQVN